MKPAKASSFLWLHEYHEPHLCTKGPLLWRPFPARLACSAASLLAPSAGSQAHAGFSRFVLWVPPPGLQMLLWPCPGPVLDTLQKRGDISEVTGGQSFLRNSVQAWCCPAPQHSMELPLPEAAKNTPDRNPASLQQTRKAWTIKAQSRALVEGVSWTPAGASGTMWNSPGGKLSSGHPLLHAQQHLTRDFPHQPLLMDYRRSLLCLSFPI